MFSVLIPAFNEAKKIKQVVQDTLLHTDNVVVVDDGSDDDTGNIAQKVGATVLRNHQKEGLGSALTKGLIYLFERGIQLVVTIDGDGAHDPSLIPQFVKHHITEDADLTIGSRLLNEGVPNHFPSPKRAANRFATLILKKVCNVSVTDVASGMRVVTKKFLELPILVKDYGFSYELICAATQKGFIVKDYPILVRYDATELFATKRLEIMGLLNAAKCFSLCKEAEFGIDQISENVKGFTRFGISIQDHIFFLYPLHEYDAYLFQEQHTAFKSFLKEENVISL